MAPSCVIVLWPALTYVHIHVLILCGVQFEPALAVGYYIVSFKFPRWHVARIFIYEITPLFSHSVAR